MRPRLAILALLIPACFVRADDAAAPKKVYVAVFDLAGDERLGAQLADTIRLKLRRQEGFEVIDRLSTQEVSGPIDADADAASVTKLMTDRLGVNLALYGTAAADGSGARVHCVCIDLTGESPRQWSQVFADDTERARGLIAARIVETITQEALWTPPEYGDEAEPEAFGKPLNANGDFENGHVGWDAPDDVSTFIEPRSDAPGHWLRFRTDLARDPWLAYRRKLMFGQADPSRPPDIPRDISYASVAALEGVHFRGEWIAAEPGRRYWMLADMKGKTTDFFFPKVFVKGFGDFSASADGLPETSMVERGLTARAFAAMPEAKRKALLAEDAKAHPDRYRREVYRWYLACRNLEDVWLHYAAPFPPRGGLPKNVQWLQVQVYTYWPPGRYLFDNVHLYADPRQDAPAPEEKARTAKYEDVRQKMEEARTRPATE